MLNELKILLLIGPTQMLRLWFGLMTCLFAFFISSRTASVELEFSLTFELLPQLAWSALLVLVGSTLIYGAVTSRYSKLGLALEGILGTAVWAAIGITGMISQGSLGAVTIGILLNMFLLIRYPIWQENP